MCKSVYHPLFCAAETKSISSSFYHHKSIKMQFNKSGILVVFLLSVLFACKKDEVVPVPGPKIHASGKADTLHIGGSLVLRPNPDAGSGILFRWTVNGATAGNDSVYTFTAKEHGDYRVVFTASNQSGIDSVVYVLHVCGRYENGFFMVEEGQYGSITGDVAYYSYDSNKVLFNVYKLENPGGSMGPVSSTLQFANIWNGKLYMVAKVGGPLVVTDAYTMKETGRINSLPQDEGHAFVGIDKQRGLLSAVNGIYRLNLEGLTIGEKVAGIDTAAGDMLLAGKYIFAVTQGEGMVILNANDYSIAKKYKNVSIGFTRTKDGAVWAAGGKALVRVDPVSLDITEVPLPFNVTNPWAYLSWRSGSITSSVNRNEVYIAERSSTPGIGGDLEYGGTKIFRYVPGNAASLSTPFITLPAGNYFYGCSMRFNERTKELVAISTMDEWGASDDNKWFFYDAATGVLKHTVNYKGYSFPAMPVFY
jgi:hypothetical protein